MKKTLLLLSLVLTALQGTAQDFDNLPTPVEEKVIDNTPDSIAKALMNRPAPGSTRQGQNPVLFLIGNSTMRNGTMGNGNNGQWGWGYFASDFFDGRKISVENQALGGMSTRNFYTDLWPAIRQALKPGDWVIVSIGHNDKADFFDAKRARGVIDGVAEDTMIVGFNERKHIPDTVYSYGHYLRCYIRDIRQAGANPILMSLTPRDARDERGLIIRKPQTQWASYIAATEGVPFVDLNELSGRPYPHLRLRCASQRPLGCRGALLLTEPAVETPSGDDGQRHTACLRRKPPTGQTDGVYHRRLDG